MGDVEEPAQRQNCVLASNPDPSSVVPAERWQLAEQETRLILCKFQPTVASEGRRRDVLHYVQRLIKSFLGLEVFAYGSVPLKTYLPDGDIDLTAFGPPNVEDILVGDVRAVLEGEENNKDAEFEVKDVQYINAEVKLVKCLVQNIVVDISFNQIGGLCTLYFLEKVNMIIGKDNLFKRSIILIKAWCYYESRILGAHHALISTYALETLVLYIFHLFSSSLDGPLAVLYKFLDYFSKFDWDKYCVSLHGPVPISSLPQLIAEAPQNDGAELLLTKEFLNDSRNLLPYFQRVPEVNHRIFVKKHLNIVDPLKENNNLGRSVSKGNFHRIRSAFAYGARKLCMILSSSRESMQNDLRNFFMNTLERHGTGDRPDVRGTCSIFSLRSSFHLSDFDVTLADMEKSKGDKVMAAPSSSEGDHRILGSGNTHDSVANNATSYNGHCPPLHENGNFLGPNKIMGPNLTGTRYPHFYVSHQVGKHRYPHASSTFQEENGKFTEDYHNAHFSQEVEGGIHMNGCVSQHFDEIEASNGRVSHSSTSSQLTSISTSSGHLIPGLSLSSNDSDGGEDNICDAAHSNNGLSSVSGAGVSPSDSNDLADLCGDIVVHSDNLLLYARCSLVQFPSGPPSPFQGNHAWDSFHHHSVFPHLNGVVAVPPFLRNIPKPNRGTGPYFPNMHHQRPFRNRSFQERGRNPFPNTPFRHRSNNGYGVNRPIVKCDELGKEGYRPDDLRGPASVATDFCRPGTPEFSEIPTPTISSTQISGAAGSSQIQIAFGSFGPVSLDNVGTPPVNFADSSASQDNSSSPVCSSLVQKPSCPGQESKMSTQSFKLKDETDFPPLAGRGSPSNSVPLNRLKTVWEVKKASALV